MRPNTPRIVQTDNSAHYITGVPRSNRQITQKLETKVNMKVERVSESVKLGEGPHWDIATQSLFYVDIFGETIHKYTPATKTDTKANIGEPVSFIIPLEGSPNKFLISMKRDIAIVTWDGISDTVTNIEKIAEVDTDLKVNGNRLNDAKCDASGRLWAGTMGEEKEWGYITPNMGSLFSVDSNRDVKSIISEVSCSNGLAWSEDNSKFYYIDSPTREIHQYDFDLETGTISNKKIILSLDEVDISGFPDGQTIDSDGNLWIAMFNGYRVIQIDPRKKNTVLREIPIPAKQVTSCAFGGENLDELYVTTASFEINGVELPPPDHGALYKVTGLDAKGVPAFNAIIC